MPRKKKERDPQDCPVCGETFIPKKEGQIYCKIACVATHARLRKLEKSMSYTQRVHLGYTEIKVDGKWRAKHRYLFEQYWDVVLRDTDSVTFLDGDKTNCSRENLALRNPANDRLVKSGGKLPKRPDSRPAIPTRRASLNRTR